ncbi:DUF6941 family protein [Microbispora sp. H10885]|uniref:DUF6941 family protein n=1 Tax=Microbispora sp. H10885 TaxID=2729110 RepID=UPI0016047C0B|nr:hypothetical protein [Microbispora sp. H10885]
MEAFLVLADAAHNEDGTGKIGILGGGWSIVGPSVPPMSVVTFLRIDAHEAVHPIDFVLRLLDAQRRPVSVASDGGERRPLEFGGRVHLIDEDKPIDELTEMVGFHASFAIGIGRLPIRSGQAYTWILDIAGREAASLTFAVRAEADEDDEEA